MNAIFVSSLLLCILCIPFAASQEAFDQTGHIDVIAIEGLSNQTARVYRFRTASSTFELLFPATSIAPATSGNYRVVGSLNTATSVVVSSITSTDATLRRQVRFRTPQQRTIVLVRVIFSGTTQTAPMSTTDLANLFFDGSATVNGFYQYVSKGTISFVRDANGDGQPDIYTVSIDSSVSCFFIPDAVQTALKNTAGVDMYATWQHHVFAVSPDFPGCGVGVGNLGCSQGACNVWSSSSRGDVFTHELGHNLGLDHANSLYPVSGSNVWQEYTDFSSSMSMSLGKLKRGFNSYNLMDLDVIQSTSITTLSLPASSTNVVLNDLYADAGTRVVVLNDQSGKTHHVTFRIGTGAYETDMATNMGHPVYPGTFSSKVFVHRRDTVNGGVQTFLETVLNVSGSYTLSDSSWTVTFTSVSGSSANIVLGAPNGSGGGSAAPTTTTTTTTKATTTTSTTTTPTTTTTTTTRPTTTTSTTTTTTTTRPTTTTTTSTTTTPTTTTTTTTRPTTTTTTTTTTRPTTTTSTTTTRTTTTTTTRPTTTTSTTTSTTTTRPTTTTSTTTSTTTTRPTTTTPTTTSTTTTRPTTTTSTTTSTTTRPTTTTTSTTSTTTSKGTVTTSSPAPNPVIPTLYAPGRIQAEHFDFGKFYDSTPANLGGAYRLNEAVDIEVTSDIGGGYDIGWMTTGEWMDYSVLCMQTGRYRLEMRLASVTGAARYIVMVDNVVVAGPIRSINTGGWQSFTTVRSTNSFQMSVGMHKVRIFTFVGGANFNYFDLIYMQPGDTVPPATSDNTISNVPQPVKFAQCGNGVCEAGESCFNCGSDCAGQPGSYCCSGDSPLGYFTGPSWSSGAGHCTPPPSGVLPSQ